MRRSTTLLTNYFPIVSLVNLLLALALVGFGGQFVLNSAVPQELDKQIQQVQKAPFAPESHRGLARLMGTYNKTGAQLYELQLAQSAGELMSSDNSFVQADRQAVLDKQTNLTSLKKFWVDITTIYPNYRDAWVMLYMIGLEMKDVETVREAQQRISYLDPNIVLPQSLN
jgi:hypothetical protein